MTSLSIALVGFGRRANAHLLAIDNADDLEVVAIVDPLESAREAARGRGIPHVFADLDALLEFGEFDVVSLTTPPTERLSAVSRIVTQSDAVIAVEKPVALTPSELEAIARLGADKLIAVNTQFQWMPHWKRIWAHLEQGELGSIHTIRASTQVNILEQGPHVLDLALKAARLSGLPRPTSVFAAQSGVEFGGATTFGDSPVPSLTTAIVSLGDDARLFFDAGATAPGVPGDHSFEQYGDDGIFFQNQVELVGTRGRAWVSINADWQIWREEGMESGATRFGEDDIAAQIGFYRDIALVVNGSMAWSDFPTEVGVAADVGRLMFAMYASAQRGAPVELPQVFDDTVITNLSTSHGH